MDINGRDEGEVVSTEDLAGPDNSSRARNRTVMITPELTSSMRAQLGDGSPRMVLPGSAVGDEGGSSWGDSAQTLLAEGVQLPHQLGEARESDGWGIAGQVMGQTSVSALPDLGIPSWESAAARIVRAPSRPESGGTPEQISNQLVEGAMGGLNGSQRERIVWRTPTQLVGFLVSFDCEQLGAYLELRYGRVMVTGEGELAGNYMIIPHATISPNHAVLRIDDGETVQIQVLDQLSEHGTFIFRGKHSQNPGEQVVLSGDKAQLFDGDVIAFGDRKFHICLVVK